MKTTHLVMLFVGIVLLQRCTQANSAQHETEEATMADAAESIESIPETPAVEIIKEEPEVYTWSYPQPWLNKKLDRFHGEFETIESDSSMSRISIFLMNGKLAGRLELNANDTACVVKELAVLKACHSSQLYMDSEDGTSSTVLTYGGDSLTMDVTYHSNVRITYANKKFGRAGLEIDSMRVEEVPADLSNLKIAFTGEQDDSTFPDEYDELDWYAVASNSDGTRIFPVALSVGKLEMRSDMHGTYSMKNIKVHDMRTIDYLVSGIPSSWITESHLGGSFEKKEFAYGEWNNINFPESDWRLIQTGSPSDYSTTNTELVLMGTKNGKSIVQVIDKQPFREYPVSYKWIGDLDGDGYPDFIFNVSPKGYEDYRLYLSSQGGENELVKEVYLLLSSQYGC